MSFVLRKLVCLQCNLGNGGDLSVWEYSGVESYHQFYDHFIGNTNCVHTIVFNVADPPSIQKDQISFWLNFLQSKIPPAEPLGKWLLSADFVDNVNDIDIIHDCLLASGHKGKSSKSVRVLLVGTHADTAASNQNKIKKNAVGEFTSQAVDKILGEVLNDFGNVCDIHAHAFILDANSSNSPGFKAFKQTLSDIKSEIINVSKHLDLFTFSFGCMFATNF